MKIAVIKTNDAQTALLARLMRAEAEGEGERYADGAGNVGVNRVRGDCLDFGIFRTIEQMVYQRPGGFEATQKGYQRARDQDIRLAKRVIQGERFHPATRSCFSCQPVIVLHNGMANGILAGSNPIVSRQLNKIVLKFKRK